MCLSLEKARKDAGLVYDIDKPIDHKRKDPKKRGWERGSLRGGVGRSYRPKEKGKGL